MEVRADEASIRAAGDTPTVGQITVVGPKKLYICARRGSLTFSYHEETEVITEGQTYRVVLDPPDDDSAAKPDDSSTKSDGGHSAPQPTRRRRGFLFFLLGAALVPVVRHAFWSSSSSPSQPESPYSP